MRPSLDRRQIRGNLNPTVRQRELGKRLRELRLEHGLTVEEVAERIMCSATKISRLETGTRRPSLRDVKDLCLLYEVDKSTADEFMIIAREAREQEWWTQFEDLNLDPYLGLEEVASAITSYTMYYMPALLQIEDYTRIIIETIAPKMDPKILQAARRSTDASPEAARGGRQTPLPRIPGRGRPVPEYWRPGHHGRTN